VYVGSFGCPSRVLLYVLTLYDVYLSLVVLYVTIIYYQPREHVVYRITHEESIN